MTTLTIFSTMLLLGFTCSLGCGTVATPFVLGSLLGEGQDIHESRRAILIFSLGKIVTLTVLGFLASLFGSVVLTAVENVYPNATIYLVRLLTTVLGVRIIWSGVQTWRKSKMQGAVASGCSGCPSSVGCPSKGGCGSASPRKEDAQKLAHRGSFFMAGVLMASIPCGPLLMALTYASTMNLVTGTLLLTSFGFVNSIFPVVFYASLVGLANREFKRDAPALVQFIKPAGGVILIYAAMVMV